MGLDIQVYTGAISDDLIPKLITRLNEFEMDCEVHPEFSFENHSGFLPFKFHLTRPPFPILKDKILISGFELYIEDFDFEKAKLKAKPGLLSKWFGKKQSKKSLYPSEIEPRMKDCKKDLFFVWQGGDSFEMRFALLTSAVITELTQGVCYYEADNIWYENENLVENTWKEIQEFETTSLKEKDLKFHEFESW